MQVLRAKFGTRLSGFAHLIAGQVAARQAFEGEAGAFVARLRQTAYQLG
jgi:hypothetical protein